MSINEMIHESLKQIFSLVLDTFPKPSSRQYG